MPSDPAAYQNVILDAKPLSDGGWLVLLQDHPRRGLIPRGCYGCGIFGPRWGRLLRLDKNGAVVAEEHASEPLGLERIDVFEDLGVVIGQGKQVLNGTLHALRLDNLDGIASNLAKCVPVGDSCWSYGTQERPAVLEERDPRDLHVIRAYPQLALEGLVRPPSIFPQANLIAWTTPDAGAGRYAALDQGKPISIPWLGHLGKMCAVFRLADDRAFLLSGPAACRGETGWVGEIVEVTSGRVLFTKPDPFPDAEALDRGQLVINDARDNSTLVDPFTAVPAEGIPLYHSGYLPAVDWRRGIALVQLTNGGAAVFRRTTGPRSPKALTFSTSASGSCRDVDFPRLVIGPARFTCDGMDVQLERGQLALATGRNYRDPVDPQITEVSRDDATRELTLIYSSLSPSGSTRDLLETSPVRIIDVPDLPDGEWLVRLANEKALSATAPGLFAIRIPPRGSAPSCAPQAPQPPQGQLLPTKPGPVQVRVVRDEVWTRPSEVPAAFTRQISPGTRGYRAIVCHPVYAYGYGNAEGSTAILALGGLPSAFHAASGNPNDPPSLDNPTPGLGLQLWAMDAHFVAMTADASGTLTVTLEPRRGFEIVIFDVEAVAISPHPRAYLGFRFVDASGTEVAPSFERWTRASWENGRAPAP